MFSIFIVFNMFFSFRKVVIVLYLFCKMIDIIFIGYYRIIVESVISKKRKLVFYDVY